jgi:hypothetical protein
MIIDAFQLFSGTANGASGGITASAYTDAPTTGTQPASNIIDYGIVAGIPAGGATTPANRDMGIGDDPALKISGIVTTAFTGGTSLQLQLQGAPDNASGAAGTYYTLWTGPVIAEANLVQGALLANVDFPREIPGVGPTRYIKLNYISVGTHGAGAIEAFVALDEFRQIVGVSGAISGYPAGVNVAN